MTMSEAIWAAVCFSCMWLLSRVITKAQAEPRLPEQRDYPIYPPPRE
jgi:hypothetical protein